MKSLELRALTDFASNNDFDKRKIFSKVVEKDGFICELNFDYLGIKTLKGLECLEDVRFIDVSGNGDLTSLEGLPTKNLQILYAFRCGLRGDLTAIQHAAMLEILNVSGNLELESLDGIPANVKEIGAALCRFKNITALQSVIELESVDISWNRNITSLEGMPTKELKKVFAFSCDLVGDLSSLKDAAKLEFVGVSGNFRLTSFHSKK